MELYYAININRCREDIVDKNDIFRIEEESSIMTRIFVTDTFKKNFEDWNLFGINFSDTFNAPIKIYQD